MRGFFSRTCAGTNPKWMSMGDGHHRTVANRPSDTCNSCVVQTRAQGWETSWDHCAAALQRQKSCQGQPCQDTCRHSYPRLGPWAVPMSYSHLKRSSPPPQLPMDTSSFSNAVSALLGSCCAGLDVQTHLWLIQDLGKAKA